MHFTVTSFTLMTILCFYSNISTADFQHNSAFTLQKCTWKFEAEWEIIITPPSYNLALGALQVTRLPPASCWWRLYINSGKSRVTCAKNRAPEKSVCACEHCEPKCWMQTALVQETLPPCGCCSELRSWSTMACTCPRELFWNAQWKVVTR